MIGIIVTGHGNFGEGLTSAVELIAGKQEQYEVVTFLQEKTPEQLGLDLRAAIANVDKGDGVIIFTDLKGGTPFKEAAMITTQIDNIEVLTGTNLAMLLEASLMRMGDVEVIPFTRSLAETGASQVDFFSLEEVDTNDDFDGDGI
ncbi:PTS sugar transporter subunit IIA [Erysipelothrix sp. HDW6C]|uniref:PTS galactosamine/N-acetylgalactosamine transporter subunit IIA n=1 Tax=Erysipelothrix sp. HDW6C TaxID=2714930 RepID=UPI00140C0E4C|nr:PTS galactosamine/N-acetylgalactosamine transporter subunit IIA [Erysipelothrix sp. HDW6C]QIK69251.1 PTS sugar transporter subunit IIA [Erysipelothrix sp. HDW6C]